MSIKESDDQAKRARKHRRRFLLGGIGLLAAFPVGGLVLSALEKIQDVGDRTK